MTIRSRKAADGAVILFIDIRYRTVDGGKHRFRRDAQIQTKSGARAEERRLLAELERTGTLSSEPQTSKTTDETHAYTFQDAVRHFRKVRAPLLKPSTRITNEDRIARILIPRFGTTVLTELGYTAAQILDAELAKADAAQSTRRNVQIVFRSVMRTAVDAGMLEDMPRFARLPRVGRKAIVPRHRVDVEAILAKANPSHRLAFMLAAFAGLRAGEVRGLQWSDVDMVGYTITVRRAISRKEVSTPKSGDHRVVPFGEPLKSELEKASLTRTSPWGTVALTSLGKPWSEGGLNQALDRTQRRAGLTGWTYHDLRHFYATELGRLGASAPIVQKLLGHADLATTQRYIDLIAEDVRVAVNRFEGNSWATAG